MSHEDFWLAVALIYGAVVFIVLIVAGAMGGLMYLFGG
jgi:hypothetical protein